MIAPERDYKLQKVNFLSILGDAPKDFITDCEYREGHRTRRERRESYIAKVGSKFYPNESIIEHLITRVGQTFGLKIADSKLRMVSGQVRFMSKYFLNRHSEQLTHGAEIFEFCIGKENYAELADKRAGISVCAMCLRSLERRRKDDMPIKKFAKMAMGWLGVGKEIKAPLGVRAEFLLKYDELLIGTLSVQNGKWRFEYSDDFRRADTLRPLVEFPDVNKVYEKDDLWQFFAMRIPSTQQEEIEEILEREQIDEDDAVRLLQRFGKRTIANPFELERRDPVAA